MKIWVLLLAIAGVALVASGASWVWRIYREFRRLQAGAGTGGNIVIVTDVEIGATAAGWMLIVAVVVVGATGLIWAVYVNVQRRGRHPEGWHETDK